MKLGVFTGLFAGLPLEAMLERVRNAGLDCIEIGTGAFPGNPHCETNQLLESAAASKAYRHQIDSSGLFISALACQGNPLHPLKSVAQAHQSLFEKTVLLAERLEVPVINLLSGCPGESMDAQYPNWSGFAWPPEYPQLWKWQWEEVAIPYWKKAASFAKDHGIHRLAIEMHPGFLVYNPETACRLIEACGNNIGVNFDPSHLYPLGIDIPAAIARLGDSIFHCHAKDVAINRSVSSVNGYLDGKPYSEVAKRSWNFRTVGWGHGFAHWREIVAALRMAGYDYVLSIEHEDPLASAAEGFQSAVDFLKQSILREPAGELSWA